ncbi:hypothetical protein AJ80_06185 [Polytolypa hystricis UAMH7299]|uniref:Uncharacterized protein n=1 Tax=Polytolypa hystricis (strain UAMH7299) TaxID=1447883 RepID=A0A2B7XZA0_POLH7|nr:hypothetical protein AJ80_06185 [Polytolypa hystricis UAMH7299]
MAPSVVLDMQDDLDFQTGVPPKAPALRSLLLSPPALAAHPETLNTVLSSHSQESTDLQMLDRLAMGLVSLPVATYDAIIVLAAPQSSSVETSRLLTRELIQSVAQALRPGGILKGQDGSLGNTDATFGTEAVLAGLIPDSTGNFTKPAFSAQQSVPLKLGRKKKKPEQTSSPPVKEELKKVAVSSTPALPSGVGLIDFSDDFGTPVEDAAGSDDELIDEEELLDEDDMGRLIIQPPECRPKAGKRRRACKDCSCGLAQKLNAEDVDKRAQADKTLDTMKLASNDLAEVDFTIQGKVGSCGSCALGDAFRCDGCPYIGLPAFKPGEEVRLLNNDIQL